MVDIDPTSHEIGKLQATLDAVLERLDRHMMREDADRELVMAEMQEIRSILRDTSKDRDEVIQPALDYITSLKAKVSVAVVIAGAAFGLVVEGIKFGWKYALGH